MFYLVPRLTSCRLVLAIRCCAHIWGGRQVYYFIPDDGTGAWLGVLTSLVAPDPTRTAELRRGTLGDHPAARVSSSILKTGAPDANNDVTSDDETGAGQANAASLATAAAAAANAGREVGAVGVPVAIGVPVNGDDGGRSGTALSNSTGSSWDHCTMTEVNISNGTASLDRPHQHWRIAPAPLPPLLSPPPFISRLSSSSTVVAHEPMVRAIHCGVGGCDWPLVC